MFRINMSHNKQKLVYKKGPYVEKRQMRRRVVATVDNMLSVIINCNESNGKS